MRLFFVGDRLQLGGATYLVTAVHLSAQLELEATTASSDPEFTQLASGELVMICCIPAQDASHLIAGLQQKLASLVQLREPRLAIPSSVHQVGDAIYEVWPFKDFHRSTSRSTPAHSIDSNLPVTALIRDLALTLDVLHGAGLTHGNLSLGCLQTTKRNGTLRLARLFGVSLETKPSETLAEDLRAFSDVANALRVSRGKSPVSINSLDHPPADILAVLALFPDDSGTNDVEPVVTSFLEASQVRVQARAQHRGDLNAQLLDLTPEEQPIHPHGPDTGRARFSQSRPSLEDALAGLEAGHRQAALVRQIVQWGPVVLLGIALVVIYLFTRQ